MSTLQWVPNERTSDIAEGDIVCGHCGAVVTGEALEPMEADLGSCGRRKCTEELFREFRLKALADEKEARRLLTVIWQMRRP